MAIQRMKIPILDVGRVEESVEEMSPRSEEFREEGISKYPVWFSPRNAESVANVPNQTKSSKESKNPLISNQIDYSSIIKTQENEIQILSEVNLIYLNKLKEAEKELETVKDIPVMIKEKDKKIRALEVSLELAKEELKMLQELKAGKEIRKKSTIFSWEVYEDKKPKRNWTVSEEILRLDQLKRTLKEFIPYT